MKFDSLLAAASVGRGFAQASGTSTCVKACDTVAKLYPDQVITSPSSAFKYAQLEYWNGPQRNTAPACFFQPTSANQVQAAIKEVTKVQCPFSIKGSGHSSNFDGSSIEGGFQFDLINIAHHDIISDGRSVKIGPGNRWGPLFSFLEEHGLTVAGGRDSGVGASGFIFGVLANGTLITVDSTSHPDLHKALQGGGAQNFGIVTSMTLNAFQFGGMWGGIKVTTADNFEHVFNAYDRFARKVPEDEKAHMFMDFARVNGTLIVAQYMYYAEPVKDPMIFDDFRPIPAVIDTLRLANHSEFAKEMEQITDTRGKRNLYWTRTFSFDIELLKSIYGLWVKISDSYADRLTAALDAQLIYPKMRKDSSAGSLFGLDDSDDVLQLIVLSIIWEEEADDEEAVKIVQELDAEIDILVKVRGKHREFKYMNYGHNEQDIITGYGQKSKAFLKRVASQYDPDGVFQKLRLGGFKINNNADNTLGHGSHDEL
ncbi:Bifunctional solanapyrone synthase [Fusarium oxysporum f. sp. raphani]|uniref:Bifunctional solanapyrone synthase n=1 Tax=Fusarium oxysporum f. sp. raphani TaxID=96318 RepID=A0A8J5U321_FUSOX|nr:Bifunctional solanapyrone synthase [Fusarium oxysporum f. sp. raphani]